MRIFFCIFILFALLLIELYIGTSGIYLPLAWMGFFYFFEADYLKQILLPFALICILLVDLLLFHRILLPDFFIFVWLLYYGQKYKDFWRSSIIKGSFFAPVLLVFSYAMQFTASLLLTGFSVKRLSADAALMIALLPFAFLLQMLLIKTFDFLQMKMRLEVPFIVKHIAHHPRIYRRRGGANG